MHPPRAVALCMGSLLLGIAIASPGATPPAGPWGEVSGERLTHSTNRAGTTIKTIDGLGVAERQPKLRPGMHTIVVHWTPKGGLKTSDRTVRVDVKACKRYYINAQFASPGSSLWQAVVDKVEDIPGCKLPAPPGETAPSKPPAKGERS